MWRCVLSVLPTVRGLACTSTPGPSEPSQRTRLRSALRPYDASTGLPKGGSRQGGGDCAGGRELGTGELDAGTNCTTTLGLWGRGVGSGGGLGVQGPDQ